MYLTVHQTFPSPWITNRQSFKALPLCLTNIICRQSWSGMVLLHATPVAGNKHYFWRGMLIALTMVSLAGLTKYDITLTRSWRFCSCNVKKKKEPIIISIFNFINKQLLLYSKKRDISFLYWLINRADQQSGWMTNWLTIDWLAVDWLNIDLNIDFLIKLKIIMWHLILWTPPKQHDFTYNI